MKFIAPLMIEHRLIERMISLLEKESKNIILKKAADVRFILSAIDFLRTYADKTHHGKEEDILFKELSKKKLKKEYKRILEELLKEHTIARKNVKSLSEAVQRYESGDSKSLKEMINIISFLINLYPMHIKKEDSQFFIPIMEYFDDKEQDNLLKRFMEFDRSMIHEKYKRVVEQYE